MSDIEQDGRTKDGRFKPGTSGNRKGRPKKRPPVHADIIRKAMDAPIEYPDGRRTITTTRRELGLRLLRDRAVKGIIAAADQLLNLRIRAERDGDIGIVNLIISDWLPEQPGQTADDRNRAFAANADADPTAWWKDGEQLSSASPIKAPKAGDGD